MTESIYPLTFLSLLSLSLFGQCFCKLPSPRLRDLSLSV
ncbi:MAG: hypothetical protein Metus_0340 [Candidatus Methanosuratincola subterraneus]|uniref:Uncharacterized protein n=1 Tax=Methanosuratincola subterraneus TaxID=2593994 RepID=A0A3S3VGZ8_METS7|nr:MAG: hypothetical protein Metus_0340 [Candidatus Methanosuratincola subterraneus]